MKVKTRVPMNGEEFNLVYKKHFKQVTYHVRKFVKTPEDVEEIVNDTFIKIFNNISMYNNNLSKFETWIYNVAKNTALDFLKVKKLNTFSINENLNDNAARTDAFNKLAEYRLTDKKYNEAAASLFQYV